MKRHTIKFPEPKDFASCPGWLGEYGKRKWISTVKALADVRPIEELDADCLACYCEAHDELHKAMATLKEVGRDECVGPNGALYPHPAVGQKNKAIDRIRKFGRELGINRSVRKSGKTQRLPMRSKPA